MSKSASDIEKSLQGGTLPPTDSSKQNTPGLVKVASRSDSIDYEVSQFMLYFQRKLEFESPASNSKQTASPKKEE